MKSLVLAFIALFGLAGIASAGCPGAGAQSFGYSHAATQGFNYGHQYHQSYGQQYNAGYHQSYDVQFLVGIPLAIVNPYTPTLAVSPQAVYVQPAPLVIQQPQPVIVAPPVQVQPVPQPQVLPKVQRQNLTSDDGFAEVTTASYRPRQTIVFADTVDPGCNYVPRGQNIVIASDSFGYVPRQNLRFNDRALAYVPRQHVGHSHGRLGNLRFR